MPRSLAALALVALLAACASSQPSSSPQPSATLPPSPTSALTATPSPTATVTATVPQTVTQAPIPTSTSFVHFDCISFADIYAWQDLDGDGQPGADEPPLPGVIVVIEGFGWSTRTTNDKGEIEYGAIGSCPAPVHQATANPPAGYHLTTPDRVTVPRRTSATPQFVRFGFAKDAP